MTARRFHTQPKRLLDADDIADLIGLSGRRAVYRRLARGSDFPRPVRIGRSMRWRPEDVADWLDGLYIPPDDAVEGGGPDDL